MTAEISRITSLAGLEALAGAHVAGDAPEIFWEDSHGHFQFDTETEALLALNDPYYQKFLPEVDWSKTVIREVRVHRAYCSDAAESWRLAEKACAQFGPLTMWRQGAHWCAMFGDGAIAEARMPAVAICLAALHAKGIRPDVNHDRIDAQLNLLCAEKETATA